MEVVIVNVVMLKKLRVVGGDSGGSNGYGRGGDSSWRW